MFSMRTPQWWSRRLGTASRRPSGRALAALAAAVVAAASAALALPDLSAAAPAATSRLVVTTGNWTVYHLDALGNADYTQSVNLAKLKAAWTSPALDGELYGEPLVFGSAVYVATENDTVYALSAASGKVLWHHHVATPVPASDLPCGDISPTVGVTSTPVIDSSRGEIFVLADTLVNGGAHHRLYGLDASTGKQLMSAPIDPPGSEPAAILNRASLTLDQGRVIFGYGGNAGDCPTYHGWVGSISETGGAAAFFEVDKASGDSQGAVWMGGAAPIIQKNGDIWVATGNGSVTSSTGKYDDSDGVLELSPSLQLLQFFAPSGWYNDNAGDADLGSAAPAVVSNGLVVQAGKSQTAYLLRQTKLGGVGGQIRQMTSFCGGNVDGGVAVSGGTVYLPCQSGVVAVGTSYKSGTFRQLWQTSTGAGGPPIIAGGLVWSEAGGSLYGLNPATGAAEETLSVGGTATSFPTPSVGDGLILAIGQDQVKAFAGT
jgi:polyvinyl alcohol dehydrogenase (cytochrome)